MDDSPLSPCWKRDVGQSIGVGAGYRCGWCEGRTVSSKRNQRWQRWWVAWWCVWEGLNSTSEPAIPALGVRVCEESQKSDPYPYPHVPIPVPRMGFKTHADHYWWVTWQLLKSWGIVHTFSDVGGCDGWASVCVDNESVGTWWTVTWQLSPLVGMEWLVVQGFISKWNSASSISRNSMSSHGIYFPVKSSE